ncbi:uncharacterized protein LOC120644307 [Panicum virgatum]|uniref:uncharacterized protein LOC120644307 n=1 Tax=Panicum virgatum TaxID=38727 RepID=UPI0019D5D589|nr:uncharacterized protein LOC120644307 [Panicum virgatum]
MGVALRTQQSRGSRRGEAVAATAREPARGSDGGRSNGSRRRREGAVACAAAMAAGSTQDMEDMRRPALRPPFSRALPWRRRRWRPARRPWRPDPRRAWRIYDGWSSAPSSSLLPSIRVLAAHGVDADTRAAIRRRAVKVVQVTSNALALVNATTGVLPFLPISLQLRK